jgi:hypothetical protein
MEFISKHFDNHFHEGFKIKVMEVRLSEEELSFFRKRLRLLIPKTPYGSFTTLSFKASEGKVIGLIKVQGPGLTFSSKRIGLDPELVFRSIEEDILNQLLRWKKSRFLKKHFSDESLLEVVHAEGP